MKLAFLLAFLFKPNNSESISIIGCVKSTLLPALCILKWYTSLIINRLGCSFSWSQYKDPKWINTGFPSVCGSSYMLFIK